MKKLFLAFALLSVLVTPVFAQKPTDMIKKVQDVSITVRTKSGSGSGVIVTRKFGTDNVSFILTADHVTRSLRHTKEVIDGKTGTKREKVGYDDAEIIQTVNENGRLVGSSTLLASVVKCSQEEDLCLLMVRKKNISDKSTEFYLDEKLPDLGEDVWNVGSALGLEGSGTVSRGVYSHHGRLLRNQNDQAEKVYDQVSISAFPGCSGSGVFLNDGRMIGALTNGNGETFILVVPTRRIVEWAKDNGLEWVVNSKAKLPTLKQIDKIIVEDNGVSYAAEKAAATAPTHSFHPMIFLPFEYRINKLFLDNKVFVGDKNESTRSRSGNLFMPRSS